MKTLSFFKPPFSLAAFLVLLAGFPIVFSAPVWAQEIITVQNGNTLSVGDATQIYVYNIRGMNINVKGVDADEITYKVFIRANENAMLRNFGGGRIYNKNNAGVLELYFQGNDEDVPNVNNRSWIKSLFTSSEKYETVIKEAVLTLEVPKNLLFKVNARYSNITVADLDKNVELKSRSGDIDAKNLGSELLIDNDYGNIKASKINGRVSITSRSSTSELTDINGALSIQSDYSTLRLENVKGSVEVSNKSGSVKAENLARNFDHRGNYTTLNLKHIEGVVTIENTSGSLEAEHIGSLVFSGNYSDITVEKILLDRMVTIDCKSSSLKLKNVNASVSIDGNYMKMSLSEINGNLKVYNKSGSVDVDKLVGNLRIDGEYNAIDVDDAQSEQVDIFNRSGEIRVKMIDAPAQLSVRNRYGNVVIVLPTDAFGLTHLESTHGEIKHPFQKSAITREIKNDNERQLEITGSGKSKVDIRVENGSISIEN